MKRFTLPTVESVVQAKLNEMVVQKEKKEKIKKEKEVDREIDYDLLEKHRLCSRTKNVETNKEFVDRCKLLCKTNNPIGNYLKIGTELYCIKKIENNVLILYWCGQQIAFTLVNNLYYHATAHDVSCKFEPGSEKWLLNEKEVTPIFNPNYTEINIHSMPNWRIYSSFHCRLVTYIAEIPEKYNTYSNEMLIRYCRQHFEIQFRVEDFDAKIYDIAVKDNCVYTYCNLLLIENGDCNKYYDTLYATYHNYKLIHNSESSDARKELEECHRMSQYPKILKEFTEFFLVNIYEEITLQFNLHEIL